MKPFDAPPQALVADFVKAQPLGVIVSAGENGFASTPLPLIARLDDTGRIDRFEGHFARRNVQVDMLMADPRALLLFQGPHRYIPSGAVANPAWVPTWNYMFAQFEVEIDFVAEDTRGSVDRLVEAIEPSDWRPASHIPARHEPMLRRIIAFEARVVSVAAKFKLGQDESADDWQNIIDWLGDDPLADWMTRVRQA